MHPRSKHWHLLDYVLVRKRDLKDILHTRVMPSAKCHTDHHLVRCKLRLHFKLKHKKKGNPKKKLKVDSLCREELKAKFQADLQQTLDESPCTNDPSPNILWENLKSAILKTSEEVLGHTKKKNKDWFHENNTEIQDLLSKKRAAHQGHLAQPTCHVKMATFRRACSILQRKLRELQNNWWDCLAMETQLCAEEILPESQCGFRVNRGTIDMVLFLRQLQEKCREQNMGLYATFIDLTKAFDTVIRTGLWLMLERLGCPPKFLQMVIQLHENQRGQVRLNGDLSEPLPISNGVKQGCVLEPTLFSIFFSMMLKQATKDLDDDEGVYVRYDLDGSLFNLRRLQAHTKTQVRLIQDFLFEDDADLVAHTERALQRVTSCFADASRLFVPEVSLKNTEVLHQPTPYEEYRPPHICIGETELKFTQQFTYLGCTISSDAKIDKEIDNSLEKANSSFGRQNKRVWNNKSLKCKTKILVYRAVVLITLLYSSETWVTYRSHIRLL